MKKNGKLMLKIAGSLVALLVLAFVCLSIFVSTLDADKYRPRLVAAIDKQTGREAKLNGPIKFSLGFSGVHVEIQDASISNPAWASRPNMAGMGKFDLTVGLLPLLAHKLSVNELLIENADILLETNAAGQHNWDFGPAVAASPTQKAPAAPEAGATTGASLSVSKLSISNSQLAMRGADGHTASYNVASLTLTMGLSGADMQFKGDINGTPIALNVKTSLSDLLSTAPFTFDADATYSAIHLTAKGKADKGGKKASISAYEITAGKSKITGQLSADWGGARPRLHGALTADYLNPADFKPGNSGVAEEPAAKSAAPSSGPARIFSDAPLPLDGLKSADATLDVAVGEFPMGKSELKKITAKLVLSGGDLTLEPVNATLGNAPVNVQLNLNAAPTPAHLVFALKADGVDLGDLQKLIGMSPFMAGSAGADIEIASDGASAHDFASNLGGVITITATRGEILTGAAAGISSSLAALFNPSGGDDAINCLAARFIAKGGVLKDNGILIDSATSMVAGKGNINLGAETINITLNGKTKLVDIGGLVPALQIGGTLANPSYSVDAVGLVKNAVGTLLNGNPDIFGSSVPDLQTPPAGQNACVYTLDHPKAAAQNNILPPGAVDKAGRQLQNLGNSLVKGLFGK